MAKKVTIDEDECVGCESCIEICPEVFGFDENSGKAYVLDEDKGDIECVEEAVASCPTDCIEVEE